MRELIEIPAADGVAQAVLARPDDDGMHPGVVFCMDVNGLRPRVEEMCDRIASWGYVVLAPNTLYRSGDTSVTSPPRDLREPGVRDAFFPEAMARLATFTTTQMDADAPHYLAALRGLDGVDPEAPVAVVGYCMGVRVAVRLACADPGVGAVAGFHGGEVATTAPDSPHLGLSAARAAFLLGHADDDPTMDPEAIARLDTALDAAGLAHTTEVYAGALHGFTMADGPRYDEAAAERHFTQLRSHLGRMAV